MGPNVSDLPAGTPDESDFYRMRVNAANLLWNCMAKRKSIDEYAL